MLKKGGAQLPGNAEELGGELNGLAALSSTFLDRFIHHFHRRTRTVAPQARHFNGLLQCPNKRNLERLEETVPDTQDQALHHFLSASAWDDQPLCNQIAKDVDRLLGGGSDTGLFIDPSAFPKKGRQFVGTQRQWCGRLGKLENCQLGVFAALGRGHHACLIDKRLYLPKEWTDDLNRCQRAGVREPQVDYRSTANLALEIIESADANLVRYAWIGVDAEFGKQPWFLNHLDQAGTVFMADVQSSTHVKYSIPCST